MKKIIANHIPSILLREIQRMSFDRLEKNHYYRIYSHINHLRLFR